MTLSILVHRYFHQALASAETAARTDHRDIRRLELAKRHFGRLLCASGIAGTRHEHGLGRKLVPSRDVTRMLRGLWIR